MSLLRLVPFVMATSCFAQISEYALGAAQKPIAFSIVREDPCQDYELIKRFYPEDKVSMLMIASGGCTSAYLIAQAPLKDITLVDPNPAQLALAKLKIHLLSLSPDIRLKILGYAPMDSQERRSIMQGLMLALNIDSNAFGDLNSVAKIGIDNDGRYEKVFEELRNELKPYKKQVEKLFTYTSIEEQSAYITPNTQFGKALDHALDKVMSQDNLVKIFGEKATANRVQEFSDHFAARIRTFLANHLACKSAWLAHMLLGTFYNNIMFEWLNTSLTQPMPKVDYYHGFMNDALRNSNPEQYHVIHLSNIIDWLTPEEAKETLSLAYRALKPGGSVIIRQLNSNVDIPHLEPHFSWDNETAKEFLNNDRSFFYRNIFIGFKPKESTAPQVTACANKVLQETPIVEGRFFKNLSKMDKETFVKTQIQFFFAVDYFSRPMAALIARMPLHKERIDILHNIVEEHGDFSADHYHANTFKQFLNTIEVSQTLLQQVSVSPVINMFNNTLMGVCAHEDPIIAIACNGIIEYAFADISACIAQYVVERNWVEKDKLVHYNVHANLDKEHAEEFFKLIESAMDNPEQREKVITGLRLGAYIFNTLYEDLYREAKK